MGGGGQGKRNRAAGSLMERKRAAGPRAPGFCDGSNANDVTGRGDGGDGSIISRSRRLLERSPSGAPIPRFHYQLQLTRWRLIARAAARGEANRPWPLAWKTTSQSLGAPILALAKRADDDIGASLPARGRRYPTTATPPPGQGAGRDTKYAKPKKARRGPAQDRRCGSGRAKGAQVPHRVEGGLQIGGEARRRGAGTILRNGKAPACAERGAWETGLVWRMQAENDALAAIRAGPSLDRRRSALPYASTGEGKNVPPINKGTAAHAIVTGSPAPFRHGTRPLPCRGMMAPNTAAAPSTRGLGGAAIGLPPAARAAGRHTRRALPCIFALVLVSFPPDNALGEAGIPVTGKELARVRPPPAWTWTPPLYPQTPEKGHQRP